MNMRGPGALARGLAAGVLLLGLNAAPALADDPAPPSEQPFLDSFPVVLSATRLSQSKSDSPVAVTIIDRQMIEASGATDLPELFRLVPGFQVGYQNGHTAAVGYHMLEEQFSRRMQVLVDGRSIYTPAFGGVNWTDLPLALEDIERIEVIRGPNTATYGTNAFFGIISIITRHAALDRGTMAKLSIGGNQLRRAVLRHGGNEGALDWRFTIGYHSDGGFATRHDSKYIHSLNGRADYRLNLTDALLVELGYAGGRAQEDTDFGGLAAAIYPPHAQGAESHFQQVRWTRTRTQDDEWSLQFYHDYHDTADELQSAPLDLRPLLPTPVRIPLSYTIEAERYDLELQRIFSPSARVRAVWGAGARLDRVRSPGYFDTDRSLDNRSYRAFANAEWSITPRVLGHAGAMIEQTDLSGTDVSPRLAVNFHVTRNHTFRAAVSRAVRTPVLLEDRASQRIYVTPSFYDQQLYSAGGLDPETIVATELGYLGRFPASGITLDLKLYHEDVEGLISYKTQWGFPDPYDQKAKVLDNYDHARIQGFEATVDYRPNPRDRLYLAYAYTDIHATSNTQQVEYNLSAPYNQLSLLGIHAFTRDVTGSLAVYYAGDTHAWESVLERGPFRRTDLRLARRFTYAGSRGEYAIVFQGLGGKTQGLKLANVMESRAYVSLKLEL